MTSDKNGETVVVVGYGWVGQANALSLAKAGENVFYYDILPPVLRYAEKYSDLYEKIKPLKIPLERDSEKTWYVVAAGDRVGKDGLQDLSLITKALEGLKARKGKIILRSTVLPKNLRDLDFDFYIPEFLHEKRAVEECFSPFYFVIGKKNKNLNKPNFVSAWRLRANKVFEGTPEQASYIKYLSNVWNAVRIAFINEFGNLIREPSSPVALAEIEGIIDFVFEKKNYLRYGKSFGGHCLPKDLSAFYTAHESSGNVAILRSVFLSNEIHKNKELNLNFLPEWFSSWDDERIRESSMPFLAFLWLKINNAPAVKFGRKKLRFLVDLTHSMMPDRTLPEVRKIWDGLATKDARYYVNTRGAKRSDTNDFNLKESGFFDYQKYISGDKILSEILQKTSPRALEIGCGVGRMTEFFPQNFARTAAVDISPVMLEGAKKRLTGERNFEFKISDGQNLNFPDKNFDFVFSYQTLRHIPTKEILSAKFKEIYRVLKPGCIAKLHLRTGRGPYKWHWSYGVSLNASEAKDMAESAGFKFIKHEIEDPKSLWIWLEK